MMEKRGRKSSSLRVSSALPTASVFFKYIYIYVTTNIYIYIKVGTHTTVHSRKKNEMYNYFGPC